MSTLLNARQVAERLNVSIAWVLSHAEGKRLPILPSLKLGRSVRFREAEIEDFLDRCKRAMAQGVPIR